MIERILLYGIGGQGVQVIAKLISEVALEEGREVVYTTSYGGQQRGGASNANLIISDQHIGAPMAISGEITIVIVMEEQGINLYESYLAPKGLMLINSSIVKIRPQRTDIKVSEIDAIGVAKEIGDERTANMVVLGALLKERPIISPALLIKQLNTVFTGKKEKLIEINKRAFEAGFVHVQSLE